MISCVLLAAGSSSRYGSPKALAQIGNDPVVIHLQKELLKTNVGEVIVVLGDHEPLIKPFILKHKRVKFVYNKDYKFGQTSSFKKGLSCVSLKSKGVMLLPVDYPMLHNTIFQDLIDYFHTHRPLILIPCFEQKKGHPPIFHISLKDDLLRIDNNFGINTINSKYNKEIVLLPINDDCIIKSFNTREEFEELRKNAK